jgi:hypothetical protein
MQNFAQLFWLGPVFVWQVSLSTEMFYVFWMWPMQKNTIDIQIARNFSHMLLWFYLGMHKSEHIFYVQFWTLQPLTRNNRSRVFEHYTSTIKVVGSPLGNNIQKINTWSACQVKTRNLNSSSWTHHSHLMIVGNYLHFY